MILSRISYLIAVDLGQRSFPPSIIAPVLNLLRLMDNEMETVGFDFSDPEIDLQLQRLEEAMIKMGIATVDDEESEVTMIPESFTLLSIDEEDDLAFLDKD